MIKAFFISFFLLASAQGYSKTTKKKRIVLNEDNVIYFGSTFNFKSVARLQLQITELDQRLPSHKPLYIIIDSGGGSISAGLELITNTSAVKRKIHTISLFAASMAFQTVQGLGDRYIIDNGTLMSHRARGGFQGEFGGANSQLDNRYNFWLRRIERLDQVVVNRSEGKVTLKQYQDLYENEYWCDGQDCVDNGFADAVVDVVCDDSLQGLGVVTLDVMWRGRALSIKVEKNKCPMMTGVIGLAVRVDGKPLLQKAKSRFYSNDDQFQINQDIWNYVNSIVYKKEMPDRVIYLKIPSPTTTVAPAL